MLKRRFQKREFLDHLLAGKTVEEAVIASGHNQPSWIAAHFDTKEEAEHYLKTECNVLLVVWKDGKAYTLSNNDENTKPTWFGQPMNGKAEIDQIDNTKSTE